MPLPQHIGSARHVDGRDAREDRTDERALEDENPKDKNVREQQRPRLVVNRLLPDSTRGVDLWLTEDMQEQGAVEGVRG